MGRLILVDKPAGVTSHDVISRLRQTLGIKKAGHCGTLDPMATGLLLVLTGKGTRLAEIFGGHDKLYRATVRFGAATDSDDADGQVVRELKQFQLDRQGLTEALAVLAARESQRPPAFSAIKQGGVPLYKLARRGEAPAEIPPRPIRVHSLELLELRAGEVDLTVHCSAGTYVRAIARDLGELVEVPAHLSALRRLSSGPFHVDRALPMDRYLREDGSAPLGMSLDEALADLPAARVSPEYRQRLGFGAQPGPEDLRMEGNLPAPGAWVRLLDEDESLLALARVEADPEPVLRLRRHLAT